MASKTVPDLATGMWLKVVGGERSSDWIDEASAGLRQAVGLCYLFTSFIEKIDEEERDPARECQAAGALEFIASVTSSIAHLFEGAPAEVRARVRHAEGVSAVLAQEGFTDCGMQYRTDLTERAIYALIRALKEAEAAISTWSRQVALDAAELRNRSPEASRAQA